MKFFTNTNWIVRIKNKAFWLAFVPAFLMLIQKVAAVGGYVIDLSDISQRILAVVEAAFLVLALVGVVNDPTTPGVSDSDLAKTYPRPGETTEATVEQLRRMQEEIK